MCVYRVVQCSMTESLQKNGDTVIGRTSALARPPSREALG